MKKVQLLRVLDKYVNGTACVLLYPFRVLKSKKNVKKEKIVIIKLWALGDSVLTLPLIKALKTKNREITVIATNRNKQIYDNEFIDKILILGKDKIKYKEYDYAIDLEPWLNFSAILSWYCSRKTIGFNGGVRSLLYDITTPFKDEYLAKNYVQMGTVLGVKKYGGLIKIKTKSKLPKEFSDKGLVGICASVGDSMKARMWPISRFAKIADWIIDDLDKEIVFIGATEDKDLIKKIKSNMKSKNKDKKTRSTAGKLNIMQTTKLIENLDLFITNDTGPMHIAAAQNTKTISLFGPSPFKRWAPQGDNFINIHEQTKLWCRPCIVNNKGGKMTDCFNAEYQKCMKLIKIETVKTVIKKLLNKK